MKVLHVNIDHTNRGGVQQYILSVAQLLADQGHSNVIAYHTFLEHTIQDGPWPACYIHTPDDVPAQVQRILEDEQPDVAYIHHVTEPAVINALVGHLPAVVYIHGFTAVCPGNAKYFRRGDSICKLPFSKACIPMNYLLRCSDARDPRTLGRLMRNTKELRESLLKLDGFIVGSHYMAGLLAQNGFPTPKISILPPHFLSKDISLCYSPPQDSKSILFAGRLEIEKGLPYLLKALAALPDAKLIVAGDGTQRQHYEEFSQNLGVAGRVVFLGWLDKANVIKIMRNCSLTVIPSIAPETFGKTGVESLAQGRPVVAFDVGGISDWLRNGVNGYLVKPKDSSGLAERIGWLLKDQALQKKMGLGGQSAVIHDYAPQHHYTLLMDIFKLAASLND